MRPSIGLVLHTGAADHPPESAAAPAVESCSLCGGPPRLCGGLRSCSGGGRTPDHLRWLTAIRCVYAGLLLTGTPASLWGGSLFRMARLLVVAGTLPPAGIVELAAERVPLSALIEGVLPPALAVGYLEHDDHDLLWELRELVLAGFERGQLAPWLHDLWVAVPAALQTPLVPKAFHLFAVRCEACWGTEAGGPRRALYEHVDTYDQAIRCPGCGLVPPHPLPGAKVGEPHPVGRCMTGPAGARSSCMAHQGYELDREGLCVEGRAVLERAVAVAAAMVKGQHPNDPVLIEAVMKAQTIAQRAQGEANLAAMGHQMERFVEGFMASGGAASPEAVLETFAEHAERAMGEGFDALAEGLLGALGLGRLLGRKKRKRKKARKLRPKGAA